MQSDSVQELGTILNATIDKLDELRRCCGSCDLYSIELLLNMPLVFRDSSQSDSYNGQAGSGSLYALRIGH